MTDNLDVPLDALLRYLGSVQNRPHAVLNAAVFPSERGDQRSGQGAKESDISVYLSVKQKSFAMYWFRWKEKSVWSFWLKEKRAVYSGALCGVRGADQGHLVPIHMAGKKITEVIMVSLTRMEVES